METAVLPIGTIPLQIVLTLNEWFLVVWELRVTLEVRRYYTKQNILLKDYFQFVKIVLKRNVISHYMSPKIMTQTISSSNKCTHKHYQSELQSQGASPSFHAYVGDITQNSDLIVSSVFSSTKSTLN